MRLTIEFEQEEDGRWIADVQEMPGTSRYGRTKDEALRNVVMLVLDLWQGLPPNLQVGG